MPLCKDRIVRAEGISLTAMEAWWKEHHVIHAETQVQEWWNSFTWICNNRKSFPRLNTTDASSVDPMKGRTKFVHSSIYACLPFSCIHACSPSPLRYLLSKYSIEMIFYLSSLVLYEWTAISIEIFDSKTASPISKYQIMLHSVVRKGLAWSS